MKKETFYINNHERGVNSFLPVEGYYGKDEAGIEFFVHKTLSGHYWMVTELHTGLAITNSSKTHNTRRDAIASVIETLKEVRGKGVDIESFVEKGIKANGGHSPYCTHPAEDKK